MQKQVVVIGAGISGLMAAQQLRQAGIDVLLLDKGNRPGGRMATRPFEGAMFDYGAQFFTVRHEKFATFERAWEARGVVRVWTRGFNGQQDGHPRYIGQSGMNSIPAHLAQGLDIRCGMKVSHVVASGRQWSIETDFDEVLRVDGLIITTPVPQALKMLDIEIPAAQREVLESIAYERCLALMAVLEESADLPEPGARQITDGEPVCWISDNARKGISVVKNAFTIQAGPQFSVEHWDKNAEDVAMKLLGSHRALAWKLHRWKYAKPISMHPERSMAIEGAVPLVLAGDAFGDARVEGAALSGLSAAERLQELLSRP